ncbi:hypothetical protein JW979_06075 [bacterium]|nr:hypothetical protein [candidate division CSSED10-310 bacterium]
MNTKFFNLMIIVASFLIILSPMTDSLKGKCIERTLRFSDPIFNEQSTGTTIHISEAPEYSCRENWPEIPYQQLLFELPFGTEVSSITFNSSDPVTFTAIKPFAYNEGLHLISRPEHRLSYQAFDSSLPYPSEIIDWKIRSGLDPADLHHKSWLLIRVFPVQIITPDQINFHREIKLSIHINPDASKLNFSSFQKDEFEPLIVIHPPDFSGLFDDFVAHKLSVGFSCSTYNLTDILQTAPGTDDPEKLKNFIQEKVETAGTLFVLLAGDADKVPVRYTLTPGDPLGAGKIPSEGYYADLYLGNGDPADWDSDDDGIYGTYPQDLAAMDLLPDVFISRIPASTPAELQIALNHIIQYETQTTPQDEWFKRVLFAAVDIFNEKEHGDFSGIPEGERFAEMLSSDPFFTYEKIKCYETDTYPHDERAEPENVVDRLTDGAGFMAFHCHGAPDCFWLIDSCFDSSDAARSANGERLPVLFGFACSTAAFDNELPGWPYSSSGESMPEHFLLNAQGGALTYVGATRVALASSFGHAQHHRATGAIEYPYFTAYINGKKTPGQMLGAAQKAYLENIGLNDFYDYYTLVEYAGFGDPSVSIGGISPDPAVNLVSTKWVEQSGNGNQCFEPGEHTQFTCKLMNTGAPAMAVTGLLQTNHPGIELLTSTAFFGDIPSYAVSQGDAPFEIFIREDTQADQIISFTLSLSTAEGHLTDVPLNLFIGYGPYLEYSGWDIYYDETYNANVDPGDLIYPCLFIRNSGCLDAEDVALTLTTESPYIDECTGYNDGYSGTIPVSHGAISQWAAMTFHVKDTCPHETQIPFTATLTASQGGPWIKPFTVTVRDRLGPALTKASLTPRSASVGDMINFQASAFDISNVKSVYAEWEPVSGGDIVRIDMFDDGNHSDQSPNDGIYGNVFIPGPPADDYIINLVAEDDLGNISRYPEALAMSTIPFESKDLILVISSTDLTARDTLENALTHTGYDYFLWEDRFRGSLTDSYLSNLIGKTIIWTFGHDGYPSLDQRDFMSEFLENGGGLLVSGWDTARYVHRDQAAGWLQDTLGVLFKGNTTDTYVVKGVEDDPVFDGIELRLTKRYNDLPLTPDYIEATGSGHTGMIFENASSYAGAVWRRDVGVRTVFLPFSLEKIRLEEQLESLLDQIVPWLMDHPARPELDITLNQDIYAPEDRFLLQASMANPYPTNLDGLLMVALSMGGNYWFYPSWCTYPSVDSKYFFIEPYNRDSVVLLDFTWPDTGSASGEAIFIGVLIDPVSGTLISDIKDTGFQFGNY